MENVDERTLRVLLDAQAVQSVEVRGQGRRWYLVVRVGMEERVLSSVRQQVRTWASLDTLVRWLQGQGIARWCVDASHYTVD